MRLQVSKGLVRDSGERAQANSRVGSRLAIPPAGKWESTSGVGSTGIMWATPKGVSVNLSGRFFVHPGQWRS